MARSTALLVAAVLLSVHSSTVHAGFFNFFNFNRQSPACLNQAEGMIKARVNGYIRQNPRFAAGILRLHTHDCFVGGCDGSILLDNDEQTTERYAPQNVNLQQEVYGMMDEMKAELDAACGGPVVSCADILAIAARDAVVWLGGYSWYVGRGRMDGAMSSHQAAEAGWLPNQFSQVHIGAEPRNGLGKQFSLLEAFQRVGLDHTDLVALSGAHTIGVSHCGSFNDRIDGSSPTPIAKPLREHLTQACTASPLRCQPPLTNCSDLRDARSGAAVDLDLGTSRRLPPSGGLRWDNWWYKNLLGHYGVMTSDTALLVDPASLKLVKLYAFSGFIWNIAFANSMTKLGKITPDKVAGGQVYPGNTYGIRKGSCSRPLL